MAPEPLVTLLGQSTKLELPGTACTCSVILRGLHDEDRACDAVSFGMERMNFEVSRWMKGDIATSAKEDAQMLAMG